MENREQKVYILFSEDYEGSCSILEHVFISREHVEKYLKRKGAIYSTDDSEGTYFVDENENYYLVVSEVIMMSDEKTGIKPAKNKIGD